MFVPVPTSPIASKNKQQEDTLFRPRLSRGIARSRTELRKARGVAARPREAVLAETTHIKVKVGAAGVRGGNPQVKFAAPGALWYFLAKEKVRLT